MPHSPNLTTAALVQAERLEVESSFGIAPYRGIKTRRQVLKQKTAAINTGAHNWGLYAIYTVNGKKLRQKLA